MTFRTSRSPCAEHIVEEQRRQIARRNDGAYQNHISAGAGRSYLHSYAGFYQHSPCLYLGAMLLAAVLSRCDSPKNNITLQLELSDLGQKPATKPASRFSGRLRLGRARKGAARAAQLLWRPRCRFAQYRPSFRPQRVAGVLLAVGVGSAWAGARISHHAFLRPAALTRTSSAKEYPAIR